MATTRSAAAAASQPDEPYLKEADGWEDPDPPVGLTGGNLATARGKTLGYVRNLRKHYEGTTVNPRVFWEDMYSAVRPATWHALQVFADGKEELLLWKNLIDAKGIKMPEGRGLKNAKQISRLFHALEVFPGLVTDGPGSQGTSPGPARSHGSSTEEARGSPATQAPDRLSTAAGSATQELDRGSNAQPARQTVLPTHPVVPQPPGSRQPNSASIPAPARRSAITEDTDAMRLRGPRLSGVQKMLVGRERFSGRQDEDLHGVLDVYGTIADMNLCSDEDKARGLALALDGDALRFFAEQMGNVYTFSSARDKLAAKYTSLEQKTRCFAEWQTLRLSKMLRDADDEKTERGVFLDMLERLQKLQRLLDDKYKTDDCLRDQLLVAADLPEIRRSFANQAVHTAAAAQDRISSFLSLDAGSARRNSDGTQAFVGEHGGESEEDCEGYYGTDRRFYPKRKGGAFRGRGRKVRPPGTRSKRPMECWVCGGNHMARKAHSPQEVRKALESKRGSSSFFSAEDVGDIVAMLGEDEEDDGEYDEEDAVAALAETVCYEAASEMSDRAFLHSYTVTGGASKGESARESDISSFLTDASRRSAVTFRGVLLDTGCNIRSTISTRELKRYMDSYKKVPDIKWGDMGTIRGISGPSKCLGIAKILIPFPSLAVSIEFNFYITEGESPALLCLRDMKKAGFELSIQNDTISITGIGREQPLQCVNYQLWHKWSDETDSESYYTIQEAETLHRAFGHPSTDKLAKMLEAADPTAISGVRQMLDVIKEQCNVCEKLASKPRRFRLSATDPDACLNSRIFADIMYIRKKPVLHIVDAATKLQAAGFLESVSADAVWRAICRLWIHTYLGPPDILHVDQGSQFVSKELVENAGSVGITVEAAPTECPTELSVVERYHGPLRLAFQKIKEGTKLPDADALQFAVYCINSTMGPEGQVPMLLVFGDLPRPARNLPARTQFERARAAEVARDAVRKIHARNRIKVGLKYKGPYANEREDLDNLRAGDRVRVYRPKEKAWLEYTFLDKVNETVTVRNPRTGSRSLFRSNVVKPSFVPDDEAPEEAAAKQTAPDDDLAEASTFYGGAKADEDFTESRKKELEGLLSAGVFKVVPKSTMSEQDRLFRTRFVDTVKKDSSKKSRLVACNFDDQEAREIATKSPTISRCAQRIALSFAASALRRGKKVYVRDITQAYVQSDEDLKRCVYLKAPPEMGLSPDEVLLCLRPLYGVPEAGLYWYVTYSGFHRDDLGMCNSVVDPCLFVRHDEDETSVVILQVDDTLGFGSPGFMDEEEDKVKKFKCKERTVLTEGTETSFNGLTLVLDSHQGIIAKQPEKLATLELPTSLEDMVSVRSALQYIGTCCRPDLAGPTQSLAANLAATDAPDKLTSKTIKSLVETAHATKNEGIAFVPLKEDHLEIVVVTDASFAKEHGLKSRLGYIVMLADGSGRANIVDWGSKKSPRVCRSVMAAELLGLVAGYDVAYTVREMVSEILNASPQDIPIRAGVDSKTVFDAVTRRAVTLERRLLIDMFALKEAQDLGDITELFWFPRRYNVSDPLTQREYIPESALVQQMRTNRLVLPASGTYFVCEKRASQPE